MSSKDFLKRMLEAGEEHSAKPLGRTVAKVRIQFGYSGYCKGHSTSSLFKAYGASEDGERVSLEVTGRIKELGGKSKAIFGLKYKIPHETVLSFEAQWDKERFVDRFSEEKDFFEIYEAIEELDLPINEWFWCAYQQIDSPTAVEKGEDGKYKNQNGDMVYPRIIVPVEKFADEQAARTAAGGGDNSGNADAQWSDTLKENYADPSDIEKSVSDIQKYFNQIKGGSLPFRDAPDLPKPLTPPNIKRYLAEMYACETADIDIILDMTPF